MSRRLKLYLVITSAISFFYIGSLVGGLFSQQSASGHCRLSICFSRDKLSSDIPAYSVSDCIAEYEYDADVYENQKPISVNEILKVGIDKYLIKRFYSSNEDGIDSVVKFYKINGDNFKAGTCKDLIAQLPKTKRERKLKK